MSYLQFEPHGRSASGKTLIVAVRDRGGNPLGVVTWYAPWRKYVFEARPATVWDANCLRDVANHCEAMTAAHKESLEQPFTKSAARARLSARVPSLAPTHAPDCSAVVFAPGAKGQGWEPACDCGARSSGSGPR